jgi:hypothetical protein
VGCGALRNRPARCLLVTLYPIQCLCSGSMGCGRPGSQCRAFPRRPFPSPLSPKAALPTRRDKRSSLFVLGKPFRPAFSRHHNPLRPICPDLRYRRGRVMMSAPVLGLSTRLECRGRNVGAGHEKAISDATKDERGHVGGSLRSRSGQRVSTTAPIPSATLPSTEAPNPPFRRGSAGNRLRSPRWTPAFLPGLFIRRVLLGT